MQASDATSAAAPVLRRFLVVPAALARTDFLALPARFFIVRVARAEPIFNRCQRLQLIASRLTERREPRHRTRRTGCRHRSRAGGPTIHALRGTPGRRDAG